MLDRLAAIACLLLPAHALADAAIGRSTDWTHRTIAVGQGDTIHLAHRGLDAARALVFLPGMGDDWASLVKLADALPDSYGMVLVDPLGHGASSKRRGANGPGRQAEALAAALDSLGVRPFALIGHSYGGVIVQYYGAARPDLPAAVIMGAVNTLRTSPAAADFAAFSASLPDTVPESVAALQADGFFGPVTDSVLRPYIATALATPGWVWREGIDTMLASDTRDLLGGWKPRTLLVVAEHDKVIGPAAMDDLARALPQADTVRIPRTSHSMHWERPDAVAAVITAFLERVRAASLPRVEANDNRRAAGRLHGDTLAVRLVVGFAEWYPEAEDGLHVTVQAFSEAGRAPAVPAPLLRVRTGTVVHAMVRNALPDSTIHLIGLATRPASEADTVHVAPGDSVSLVFPAGEPGTYLYRAIIGNHPDHRETERETAAGAFVVDPPGGSPPDRVLVMNAYADPIDSTYMAEALAINGKSWPYTERIRPAVGDTVRWRVVNATVRSHPMHLHGFYFIADAVGDGLSSRTAALDRRPLEVTRAMAPWSTMDLTWSPDRPGNWLFHCHLTFHVVSDVRLDGGRDHEALAHSADPARHMAGLVLGIEVSPGSSAAELSEPPAERHALFINQGRAWGRMPVTYSYILQRGAERPSSDSFQVAGTTIVLTRGRATDIVVHNRAREAAAVHWHGLELGSWSDGVAGWSGSGAALAPVVAPGDSFVAHLRLPRAGTFIYHTHLNDIPQVTGGAVGALLVLEPDERHDPARDHVFLGHWNGRHTPPGGQIGLLVNGDSLESPLLTLEAGVAQRLRFINIGPANVIRFQLRAADAGADAGDSLAIWRAWAKDGADLPPALRVPGPAVQRLAVGETADFEFTPEAGRSYLLEAAFGARPASWRQRVAVK